MRPLIAPEAVSGGRYRVTATAAAIQASRIRYRAATTTAANARQGQPTAARSRLRGVRPSSARRATGLLYLASTGVNEFAARWPGQPLSSERQRRSGPDRADLDVPAAAAAGLRVHRRRTDRRVP